jgi:cytochrome b pre-mRNA-processing protein 3
MIGRFRRGRLDRGIPAALYGAIVAQARHPRLYRDLGVPDTIGGRFEMVVAHTILAVKRLRDAGDTGKAAGQAVFDLFCQDMDRTLREMGVGDLSVPKRMRKIGEAFYGRAAAYEAGLAARDKTALAAALKRNVLGGEGSEVAAEPLAAYMMAADEGLAATPPGRVLDATFALPDPSLFIPAESET